MSNISWSDRWRYRFDTFMTRGTIALLGGLFLASALLIFTIAAFVVVSGQAPVEDDRRLGLFALAWMGLLRTLDTGTMGGDTGSPVFLAAMLTVTLGGVFTVSTLIGILNNGLEARLSELRKGRSRVVEEGHTVILAGRSRFSRLSQSSSSPTRTSEVPASSSSATRTKSRWRRRLRIS